MSTDSRFTPSRRQFVALGIGAFVVAAVPLAARRRPRLIRRSFPVMASLGEIVVLDSRVDVAEAAIDAAMAELAFVERTMTRFLDDSDIGRANRLAAQRPVAIDPATAGVIAAALRWAETSDGAFDPAIGRVVETWDVAHRHEPPPRERYQRLAGRRLHRAVQVGTEGKQHVVHFTSDDVHLDLGGIACGYGVDRAADALRANGVRDALINISGDIYAMGHDADGGAWRIGVQSPSDPSAIDATVEVSDAAVATSGDYQQFFRWRGERYHHLMDPSTAAPARAPMHSTTVRAARCIDADAGSTASFCLPPARVAGVLAAHDAALAAAE